MGTASALLIPAVLALHILSLTSGVAPSDFRVQAVEVRQERSWVIRVSPEGVLTATCGVGTEERALVPEELRALREIVGREAPAGVAFRRYGEVKTTAARFLDVHLGERRWNVTFGRLSDETVPKAQRSEAKGVLRFWKAVLEAAPACKEGEAFSGDPRFLGEP